MSADDGWAGFDPVPVSVIARRMVDTNAEPVSSRLYDDDPFEPVKVNSAAALRRALWTLNVSGPEEHGAAMAEIGRMIGAR